jgi:orotate phosphoribosyltransferase
MELGAVPIATAVSLEANLPMLIIRKGERKHGTGKRIEGRETKGLRVMVVEDVTTSGKSTLEAVEVLRAAGATVAYACVVVDREAGAIKALEEAKVHLDALATVSQLLDTTDARRILGKGAKPTAEAKA